MNNVRLTVNNAFLAAGGSEGTISDVVKTGLEEKENILFDIRSKVLNQGVEDSRQAIQNIMNLPISNEEKQELIEKENEKGNQLMADLKFDAANNMFKNSFKNTDKLKEWKRSWDDNWFGRKVYQRALSRLHQKHHYIYLQFYHRE